MEAPMSNDEMRQLMSDINKLNDTRNKAPGLPWSYDEKRKISLDINRLNGNELGGAVQIMRSMEPSLRDVNPDEISVDFASFQSSTLDALEAYIASCLQKRPSSASPITLEKKQQLCLAINELEEDDLEILIDIIREENPSLQHIDLNEIGMHLETLQPSTVREIEELVDSALLEKTHLQQPYNTRNKAPGLPWSYDEKRKISLDINRLNGNELGGAVQIMRSMEPTLRDVNPDDISVDFETFQSSTLDALEAYIASCLQKRKCPSNAEDAKSEIDSNASDNGTTLT